MYNRSSETPTRPSTGEGIRRAAICVNLYSDPDLSYARDTIALLEKIGITCDVAESGFEGIDMASLVAQLQNDGHRAYDVYNTE